MISANNSGFEKEHSNNQAYLEERPRSREKEANLQINAFPYQSGGFDVNDMRTGQLLRALRLRVWWEAKETTQGKIAGVIGKFVLEACEWTKLERPRPTHP